jgi:hypothetical protein
VSPPGDERCPQPKTESTPETAAKKSDAIVTRFWTVTRLAGDRRGYTTVHATRAAADEVARKARRSGRFVHVGQVGGPS